MIEYLLDSDVLIDYFNNQTSIIVFIENLNQKSHLFASAISVAELITGWTKTQQERYYSIFLDTCAIIPADTSIAKYAGELRSDYLRKGKPISLPDSIIASTALQYGYTLFTRNKKDFPMPEIKFCNFSKPQ